jgi:hypothetical protein
VSGGGDQMKKQKHSLPCLSIHSFAAFTVVDELKRAAKTCRAWEEHLIDRHRRHRRLVFEFSKK